MKNKEEEHRKANKRVQRALKKTKEDWIGTQCVEIKICLNKNKSINAYQLVEDLNWEGKYINNYL